MKQSDIEYLREQERRSDRAVVALAGSVALVFLVSLAIVFVGCPAAVSYGISRGCASGTEVGR